MVSKNARKLRSNPTEAEKRLWSILRRRQIDDCRFRRQAPIGPYIVDFVCFERRLVIEVDGGQHASQADRDAAREARLANDGFQTLRFWNNEVLENIEGVRDRIERKLLETDTPLPDPPPQGGRE